MSGYEPGRPKIEMREAAYIWNGTRILTDTGVEWTVTDVYGVTGDRVLFQLERDTSNGPVMVDATYADTDLIRCRVEEEDR